MTAHYYRVDGADRNGEPSGGRTEGDIVVAAAERWGCPLGMIEMAQHPDAGWWGLVLRPDQEQQEPDELLGERIAPAPPATPGSSSTSRRTPTW